MIMQGTEVDVESRHLVRSADEVLLEIPVAGPVSRVAAYGVDTVVLLCIETIGILAAVLLGALTLITVRAWSVRVIEALGVDGGLGLVGLVVLITALQLVAEVGYFVGWELLLSGQTPGKRLFGLRVVRSGGLPLTPWASLVRNVLRAVDQLPIGYVVGLVSILMTPDGKRLGDVAADTIVARVSRTPRADALPTIDPARVEAVRITAAQAGTLDENAARLARSALRRLSSLDADRHEAVLDVATRSLAHRLAMTDAPADREAFLHAVVRAWDAARR